MAQGGVPGHVVTMSAASGEEAPPAGRQSSRRGLVGQLVSLVMATMTSQAMLVVLAPTLVDVSRSFGVAVSSVGQARSIAAGVAVLSAALVPRLLSRWGLRNLLLIGVGWAGLAYCAWAGALLTFIGAYFIERHGVGESLVGVLLAAGAAAYVLSSVRSGALASRIRRRRLILGSALAMCALFAVVFALEAQLWISFSVFCVIALLAGVRTPASAGLGMAQLPAHPDVMMAARTGTTQLGYLAGALSAGAVLAVADYRTLGFVLSAVMLASIALMWRVREPDEIR
jgi:predicted MFS family arabinose efflux permease